MKRFSINVAVFLLVSISCNNVFATIVENVALQSKGASATAISYGTYMGDPQYPWKAIDGDNQFGWSSNWDMPAWLMVEFDDVYTIGSVGVWWGSHKHDYSISLSMDSIDWTTVVGPAISINEEAGPILHELFSITPIDAKYIRMDITSTSAPSTHIFQASVQDLEAYTVPEPATLALIGLGGLFLRKRKS